MFILKLKKKEKKGKIEVRTHTTHPLDSPKGDPTLSPPLRSLSPSPSPRTSSSPSVLPSIDAGSLRILLPCSSPSRCCEKHSLGKGKRKSRGITTHN